MALFLANALSTSESQGLALQDSATAFAEEVATSQMRGTTVVIEVTRAESALATSEANRRLAEARTLAAGAGTAVERQDFTDAYLLALQAINITNQQDQIVTGEAHRALYNTLVADPFRTTLVGHTDTVNSVSFSPDGSRIVTASRDGTARLWDGDGQFVTVLEGHTREVTSASFSPDGSRIMTASLDDTARLWDGDGQFVTVLEGHTREVTSASFSPDGSRIVTASRDGTARLWDGDGQFLTILEGHATVFSSASFNHDGSRIVTASDDNTARLWDGDGWFLTTLMGHTDGVVSAGFSPDGSRIVTAGCDEAGDLICLKGTVRLWEVYSDIDVMIEEALRRLRFLITVEECEAALGVEMCVDW